ncbi:MAG: TonB-dependent receptor [Paraglaciecola sp.]|nr:TonB-dependent receptor [Paraglaciecola sp.]
MYKITLNILIITVLPFVTFLTYADEDLFNESLQDLLSLSTELKADVGSREGARNILYSRSPVDAITYEQINRSGLTSLTDVLRYFVAGFNAPETSVADGSDHIRAFTFRGMGANQTLVLINGKRTHSSSLLHVNGVIGRGSNSVDLDTIAVKSIEKIEILRDGAAAQYGSDAIAGVINIILKGIGHKDSITLTAGQREEGDGEQLYIDGFISYPLKYDGFVNISLSLKNQNETQRAGEDRRLAAPIQKTHVGIPESQNILATFNVEIPQKNDVLFYSNATFNSRKSHASAFFRAADNTRVMFSEGFLPIINADITDSRISFGMSGQWNNGYVWDVSNTYGYNKFEFSLENSINYTLAEDSPTSFYNGALISIQNITDFDVNKRLGKFELAAGLEYRHEGYQIESGDPESYIGTASQGFAGFKPENETDTTRTSYSIYADVTYNATDQWSIETAGRYEHFSDFGSTSNLKIATDYIITPLLLLRGSASTGFRAPSLAQIGYSQVSSFLDGDVLTSQGTFTVDHAVSQSLGAKELTPEKTKHLTIGSVYQPTKDISFMIDYFYAAVDDRIMLSNELFGTTTEQLNVLSEYTVDKARFFTNAANTETEGVDAKLNVKHLFSDKSKLDMTLWYNYSENEFSSFNDTVINESNSFSQIIRIENGQPKSAMRFLTHYATGPFNITANLSRYGAYKQAMNGIAYNFESAWTTDFSVTYAVNDQVNLSLGGLNILNAKPNKWNNLDGDIFGSNGVKPYSRYSPFGYSGAYYYLKTEITF